MLSVKSELGAHLAIAIQQCDIMLQNKSLVCTGSWITNTSDSTVMRLQRYDNRGGIIIETCTKCTRSHKEKWMK